MMPRMSMSGRLAVGVVLSLELLGARAARADTGAGTAKEGGLGRRTKPMRLDLSWAWPEPAAPPLIPAAGGAAVPAVPRAPAPPPPDPGASGGQVALAILVAIIGDTTGVLVAVNGQSILEGMIPMAIAPLAAGALVCNVPPPSRDGAPAPARGSRCRATLAGALIGAAAGLVPGLAIIAGAGPAPKYETEYHDWVQTQYSGAALTLLLYTIAMPVGTIVGYNLGGPAAPNPVTMPPVATAALFVPVFSLRF